MSDESRNDGGRGERKSLEGRVPPRTWLLWLAILSLIPLLVIFKDRNDSRYKILNHREFLDLVENNLITEATIYYNPQSLRREVTGKFTDPDGKAKTPIPFKIETRLSENLEDQLLRTGKFKVAEPNTVLLNLFYGILPFLLLAALVYFFLIR